MMARQTSSADIQATSRRRHRYSFCSWERPFKACTFKMEFFSWQKDLLVPECRTCWWQTTYDQVNKPTAESVVTFYCTISEQEIEWITHRGLTCTYVSSLSINTCPERSQRSWLSIIWTVELSNCPLKKIYFVLCTLPDSGACNCASGFSLAAFTVTCDHHHTHHLHSTW